MLGRSSTRKGQLLGMTGTCLARMVSIGPLEYFVLVAEEENPYTQRSLALINDAHGSTWMIRCCLNITIASDRTPGLRVTPRPII